MSNADPEVVFDHVESAARRLIARMLREDHQLMQSLLVPIGWSIVLARGDQARRLFEIIDKNAAGPPEISVVPDATKDRKEEDRRN